MFLNSELNIKAQNVVTQAIRILNATKQYFILIFHLFNSLLHIRLEGGKRVRSAHTER